MQYNTAFTVSISILTSSFLSNWRNRMTQGKYVIKIYLCAITLKVVLFSEITGRLEDF